MYVSPIGAERVSLVPQPPALVSAPSVPEAKGTFGDVVTNALARTNDTQIRADDAFRDLAMGRTDNIHDVVLSVAKADMSFRMMLEVRNRIMDAYQEIMRLQI
jgi:flagellar hook-basal body complex protein FliE